MANENNRGPRPARVKSAAQALIATAVAGTALVLLNVVSCGWKAKSDLTAEKIYSLLPASKRLVQKLPEKLTVKAYFGNVPAEQQEQRRYVDNLLSEYADSSKGKLVYEKYEVDASDSKDAAPRQKELEADGILRLNIPIYSEEEGSKAVPAYFNIQFNYLDKKETWQLPTSTFVAEGLEYEFTTIIKRLADGKPKLGITKGFGEVEQHQIIDLPGKDTGMGTKLGLADLYEIVPVDWAKTPKQIEDVDVLIVYGPTQKVGGAGLYYLDQHLMKGKPALLLVPGMNWAPAPQQQQMPQDPNVELPFMGTPVDNGMKELLAHYGFDVAQDTILDITNGVPGVIPLGQRPAPGKPFFPLVAALANGKNAPLQGLKALPLPYASTLKLIGPLAEGVKAAGYEVQQLFTTSPTSFARTDFLMMGSKTELKMPADRAQLGPYLAGVAVSGRWPSFFAGKEKPAGVDGAPTEDPAAMVSDAGTPTIAESQKPARLLVVSSAKWAQDESIAQIRFARTPVFLNCFVALHSMVDWATESTDLLAVRAKQVLRPLDPVSKSTRLWVSYGNVGGVPLLVLLGALAYWQVRLRRRRRVRL